MTVLSYKPISSYRRGRIREQEKLWDLLAMDIFCHDISIKSNKNQ